MMTLDAAKILSWGNDDTRVSGGHYNELSGGHMKTMRCSVTHPQCCVVTAV